MLQIRFFKSLPSTQIWLKEAYKKGEITPPLAVYCGFQTDGIGSRGNGWIAEEGNLFLSFILSLKELPQDLKLESASIYFAALLQEVLSEAGSEVWIKWPNDFYLAEKKIGGMITTVVKDALICGVGLNIRSAPKGFARLDVEMESKEVVDRFLEKVEKKILWKQVFRKYSVEFYKNKRFFTHVDNQTKVSLADAELQEDGSIIVNGERIYSLR